MTSFLNIWRSLSLNQRLILGTIGGALAMAVAVFLHWAKAPDYTVLYANVEPEDAAQIVDQLQGRKVPYQLDNGGRTILVPSKDVYESRLNLAVQGLPESGEVGYEIFDKTGFGVTDFVQRLNYRRSLEGEIARTIQTLTEVRAARVHIVLPEETLFAEDQKPATASVVLRLSGSLGPPQVAGIVRLVAASIEGLRPDNVTVVDTFGNLLSGPHEDTTAALASSQLDLKQSVEKQLRTKVISVLENVLGHGKVVAEVNADLDFEQLERTTESYDPETPAVRSEQRIKGNEGEDKNEQLTTNYELSKTLEHTIAPVGGIQKLTVAVMIDGTYKKNDAGGEEYVPRTEDELERLRGIIKTAVGFDEGRGDLLEVHNVPFDNHAVADEMKAIERSDRLGLVMPVLNKVGQVLIILLLALLLRGFYRKTATAIQTHATNVAQREIEGGLALPAVPSEDQEYRNMQQQLRQLVAQRPAEMSAVIRSWLKEE